VANGPPLVSASQAVHTNFAYCVANRRDFSETERRALKERKVPVCGYYSTICNNLAIYDNIITYFCTIKPLLKRALSRSGTHG
jgi:hypothetical protein